MKKVRAVFICLLSCSLVVIGCKSNNKKSSSMNIDLSSQMFDPSIATSKTSNTSQNIDRSFSGFIYSKTSEQRTGFSFTPPSSSSKQENWVEMTYAQFRNAYIARAVAQYNHVKFQYGDDSQFNGQERNKLNQYLTLAKGEENLIEGKWVVDREKTAEGLDDITPYMIPTDQSINQFENPPTNYTVTYFRSLTSRYYMHVEIDLGTKKSTIDAYYDRSFYVTEMVRATDGFETLKCLAEWSKK